MKRLPIEPQNLTRSFHEAVLLALLLDGPRHGYQLALDIEQKSGGAFRFKHGTLYPILHRLEKDRLIAGTWDRGGRGRPRKRYAITRSGRRQVARQRESWEAFSERFLSLLRRAAL
jgi:PadR family transcriptional regulator PadR